MCVCLCVSLWMCVCLTRSPLPPLVVVFVCVLFQCTRSARSSASPSSTTGVRRLFPLGFPSHFIWLYRILISFDLMYVYRLLSHAASQCRRTATTSY